MIVVAQALSDLNISVHLQEHTSFATPFRIAAYQSCVRNPLCCRRPSEKEKKNCIQHTKVKRRQLLKTKYKRNF